MQVLLFVLLVGALAGLVYLAVLLIRSKAALEQLEQENAAQSRGYQSDAQRWDGLERQLSAEIARLSKYRGVADADERASELRRQGEEALARSEEEAKSTLVEARKKARETRDEAQKAIDSATREAGRIVATARRRAEEIAGSAYQAMENAALYEETAKAMKNIVKGYGDEYVVPGRSLLDDLAEDFGHKEAGRQLKLARERTVAMIRNGTAAACEYVEASRRETAINFVIDAFNGKVDSILSRVKSDNAGKLKREIRDAFCVVNFNGKAFRNARIADEYLTARLEELKWAATVQQLKIEEREEQRRIREQIREEERARKEYEKAIKEAEKEERFLRKAMEEARKRVEQSREEERAKYEEELTDLGKRLQEAEDRNQRARSMAEQTRRGHVYVISNIGSFGEDVLKIGLTRRLEPLDRVRELGDSSVPFDFDIHAMIPSEDAPALEHHLHNRFEMLQINKVNPRKEFFRAGLGDIRKEVEEQGLSVRWTMAAEAREYKETLALEREQADKGTRP